MNKKIKRLIFVLTILFTFVIAIGLIIRALEENIIYFYSPSDIKEIQTSNKLIRIGGLVKENSLTKADKLIVEFVITDNLEEIKVIYQGILPDLFREKQGVIAEGSFKLDKFIATKILAKHDENYMPKEVYESIRNK
ncbi:MAG: cytochrome c maturation protein CcmE [Hyphomicrobiales bacterium]|jgi:cytochrome c-type biogenesis protein CcmE|nr:cytochrome c maturation protein CcmE [Hyphomicrobiales bacterium]|tara:strand:+ start:158 stop:568 length:411 start_codon:yes stop_codon:yes gene_type:complete